MIPSHLRLPLRFVLRIFLHHRWRVAATVAGIATASLLILVQASFFFGFRDAVTAVPLRAKADLWVAASGFRYFDLTRQLSDRDYYQVIRHPAVAQATPLVARFAEWRRPDGGQELVQVIGFPLEADIGLPWNLPDEQRSALGLPDTAAVDAIYHGKLGLTDGELSAEIQGRRVRIAGTTTDIRSFSTAPLLFTEYRAAQSYGWIFGDQFSYLLVRLVPGSDREAARAGLVALGNGELDVMAPAELAEKTTAYWMRTTGAGLGLATGIAVALLIGSSIAGLSLHTMIQHYAEEYVCLRVIGASFPFVATILVAQALLFMLSASGIAAILAVALSRQMRAAGGTTLLPGWVSLATCAVLVAIGIAIALLSTRRIIIRAEGAAR